MRKKYLIIAIISTVVLTTTIIIVWFFTQHKIITFILEDPVENIIIKQKVSGTEEIKEITTISESGQDIRLKKGGYFYETSGKNSKNEVVDFVVDTNKTITVSGEYSEKYLNSLISRERSKIEDNLKVKYPKLIPKKFIINNLKLINKGKYAGVVLSQKNASPKDLKVTTYRVLLYKKDNNWSIIGSPEIILTIHNTPNVDKEILRKVNQLEIIN